jgi:hypothetical protein
LQKVQKAAQQNRRTEGSKKIPMESVKKAENRKPIKKGRKPKTEKKQKEKKDPHGRGDPLALTSATNSSASAGNK